MSLETLSLCLNAYLVLGILLFALSKTDTSQARGLNNRNRNHYVAFVAVSILLWPLKLVIHYVVRERILSQFN